MVLAAQRDDFADGLGVKALRLRLLVNIADVGGERALFFFQPPTVSMMDLS